MSSTYKTPSFTIESKDKLNVAYDGYTLLSTMLISAGDTRFGDTSGNYTKFDMNGFQTMHGNATVFKDCISDALSLQQTGPGLATNSLSGTIDFANNSNLSDFLFTNVQLNHDRRILGTVHPHIHWIQNQNNIPNLLLQYRWHINGGQIDAARHNLSCTNLIFPYISGSMHQICGTLDELTTPVGSNISDIIQLKIYRDNANTSNIFVSADPYVGNVSLLSVDIHYEIDTIGSNEEHSKMGV